MLSFSGSYSSSSSSMSILRGSNGSSCFTWMGSGIGGVADLVLRSRSARGSEGGTRATGGGAGAAGADVEASPGMSAALAAAEPEAFLCRYACTIPMRAFSVNACKFATMRSVTRFAGSELKSNPGAVAFAATTSCSSLGRFRSGASATGVLVEDRLRDASRAAALRAFSSAAACSILCAC